MRVSAVIVNRDARELLLTCVRSVLDALEQVDGKSEVVIVDNASSDGSVEAVRDTFPTCHVVCLSENYGFPTAVARGVRESSGEWLFFLNNDATVTPSTVVALLEAGRDSRVGSVAAQIRFADGSGRLNSAGIGIDRLGVAFDRLVGEPADRSETEPTEVFGASGGGALYRRTMLESVGGIDETFFMFLEDADLAWRARMAGWHSIYAPAAVIHHHHASTTGHGSPAKYFHVGLNRVRMIAKNAPTSLLIRYGLLMLAYDTAYVLYALMRDRTTAPARGRLKGLLEWRAYRRQGQARTELELAPPQGLRRALARRKAWMRSSAGVPGRASATDVARLPE